MTKHRELNSWYVIVWRSIWWPLFMLGVIFSTVALAVAMGTDKAFSYWKRNV